METDTADLGRRMDGTGQSQELETPPRMTAYNLFRAVRMAMAVTPPVLRPLGQRTAMAKHTALWR
jgi:hypothetical protein